MLSPQLLRMQNDGTPASGGPMTLQDAFFQHQNLAAPNQLDYIVKGLAMDTQQEIDSHVIDGVRNFLFGDPIPGIGEDLASLNIQRGARSWIARLQHVARNIRLVAGDQFQRDYVRSASSGGVARAYGATNGHDNVNLVDAWVGGIAEDHVPGTDVGPLVEASLIQQFTAVRDGDRFWFTRDSGLTPDELNFVDNVTLADIIEADTGITNLQSDVFLAAVPEPASYLLAAVGLVYLTMAYRSRRAQAV